MNRYLQVPPAARSATFTAGGLAWASGMSAAIKAARGGVSCAAGPALAEMTRQRRLLARRARA